MFKFSIFSKRETFLTQKHFIPHFSTCSQMWNNLLPIVDLCLLGNQPSSRILDKFQTRFSQGATKAILSFLIFILCHLCRELRPTPCIPYNFFSLRCFLKHFHRTFCKCPVNYENVEKFVRKETSEQPLIMMHDELSFV